MEQSPETRAKQHLLVQGFTLYNCSSAVCTRLIAKQILDNPNHAWAVLCDTDSLQWVAQLPEDDKLKPILNDAASKSSNISTLHIVCHIQSETLVLPLVVTDVRSARLRIESAVIFGKSPPAERLEAFPDELIEQEAKRRAKLKEVLDEGLDKVVRNK